MRSERPIGSVSAFFFAVLSALVILSPASGQTYTFSACSGLPIPGSPVYIGRKGTFTYTINQVLFGGPVPGAPGGYSYTTMATYTASTGEGQTKDFFNVMSAVTVGFIPFGPTGQTSFGVFLPAGGGPGSWAANLLGDGSLLPNGLPQSLPPILLWNTATQGDKGDYVAVNGTSGDVLYYLIDTLGPCGGSSFPDPKTLGNPADTPGNCNCVGDPINPANGNLFEQVTDYHTAGENQLSFTRYYNSMGASSTFAASLGANWRSTYDRYLRISSSTSVSAERTDGQQLTFTLSNGAWLSDSDVDAKLTNSGTTWTLTDASDTTETYKTAGSNQALLQTIRARNGYTQTLQYNSSSQLITVTDSYQRQLSFAYSSGLLQTVTTPDGLMLTYGHSGSGPNSRLTSVSYSTSPVTNLTYLYENTAFPNVLTGIIDENGSRYVTWTYDSKGRVLSSQNAGGAGLTSVSYNDTDGSRTVADALGAQIVFHYSTLQGVPKLTQVDRPATATTAAATMKFTYDKNGYTASQTDWNGNVTNYVNDAHGQPTSIVEAAGTPQARTTTITYHPTFHLPVSVAGPGLTTAYTYDSNGQMLTKTLTDTTTTTTPYSTKGQTRTWTNTWSNFRLASVKTPRTDVNGLTGYTYDSSGTLVSTTNALGQTHRVTQHLPGGLPETIVDSNGVTTQFTYDVRQRLLTKTIVTAAGPPTTGYTYDAAGSLLSATEPDGSVVTNTYDAAHRLTAVSDLFGQQIFYSLDANGDETQMSVVDAAGNQQRARSGSFDALGRLLQTTGGAGQATAYTYDGNGNQLSVTDPLGRVTFEAYDALNRMVKLTDPARGIVATTYDANNRPISVTDPNGGFTTYVYDGFGDMIQRVSPDSGTTVYRYDANGNQIQRVDGAGITTNYTYDALDRQVSISYPGNPAENVTFTYDQGGFGVGLLTGAADAAGTLGRSYDERGNVVSETRTLGGTTLTTAYTYDPNSRVASITYPSGWTVSYARDAMGRVTGVTAQTPDGSGSFPIVTGATYQPFGPGNALALGNGVAETRTYDPDYRVTGVADSGGGAVQSLSYVYDVANNVQSIADGVTAGNSQSFGYDALDRLTSAGGSYGSVSYTYDSAGNRTSQSGGGSTSAYSYASHSNRLTSVSAGGASQAVGYTKAGLVNTFNPAAGAITNLVYNQGGRLAAAMASDSPVAQYTYDGFGQRLARTGAVTGTTLYQYDPSGRLLEETDGQGSPLVDYVYLNDQPIATLAPAAGQIYFLHNDRLGAPQIATDSSQNPVWVASYGPFGEMSTVPSGIVQDLRMPGQEFDAETGLYHNGFRDYAPGWGRYLQSDPIGLAGGMNTYGYVRANPLKRTDPRGLDCSVIETLDAGTEVVKGWFELFAGIAEFNPIEIANGVISSASGGLGIYNNTDTCVPSRPDQYLLEPPFQEWALNDPEALRAFPEWATEQIDRLGSWTPEAQLLAYQRVDAERVLQAHGLNPLCPKEAAALKKAAALKGQVVIPIQ